MQDQIKAAIKAAMIAKEMEKLQVLRLISAAFTSEVVSQQRPPTDPLSDTDSLKVLKKMAKQRKDSIDQYSAGGRPELADDERKELSIIESMLPSAMSETEIEAKIVELLAASPVSLENKGKFVGSALRALGDTADGAVVKAVIDRLVK